MRRYVVIIFIAFIAVIISPFFFFFLFRYISRANVIKANLHIDTARVISPIFTNWRALAQGGEEVGVRMLQNVIPQTTELSPRYIRLDHLYDFYHVVNRNPSGQLSFNWSELDATVCDILATGAKPFLSLGYMPPALSSDGSLVSEPKDWQEWAQLVQKTIEHYSGRSTQLCGNVTEGLTDVYYEVWNEPDLESFGKWSIYGGKQYKYLYFYSSLGANRAQNVNHFFFGGPATTALYKNWVEFLLRYANEKNLRLDFLSWHHYTTNPEEYFNDVTQLDSWLSNPEFSRYRNLIKIVSEWGYDSQPNNAIADTNIGAAYTIASIRNLINLQLEMAFSFEVKDGAQPSWGVLTHEGVKKPRFHALKFLNQLQPYQLALEGEGSHVRAIASSGPEKITVIVVNYDQNNTHTELVPVAFTNLTASRYQITQTYLNGPTTNFNDLTPINGELKKEIIMTPNSVVSIDLQTQ